MNLTGKTAGFFGERESGSDLTTEIRCADGTRLTQRRLWRFAAVLQRECVFSCASLHMGSAAANPLCLGLVARAVAELGCERGRAASKTAIVLSSTECGPWRCRRRGCFGCCLWLLTRIIRSRHRARGANARICSIAFCSDWCQHR